MATIVITGGTGYIGRHLVARLVSEGVRPRCLLRPAAGLESLPVGKIDILRGDVTDPSTLPAAMDGADIVVHAGSIVANVKQRATVDYARVNDRGTANVVEAAKKAGVSHFVHLGGVNTVPGKPDSYLRTRFNGEQHVKHSGIPYSILQPSVLFGDGSAFFSALAGLVRWAPVVPVPGDGRMLFQPIWVEDVVTCLTRLLAEPGRDETIPVGGPAYYTYDQLLDLIFRTLHKRRLKLHTPLPLMKLATGTMQAVLPKPPVTTAALELFGMGLDNTTTLDAVQTRFGFQPKSLEQDLREHGI
jgi:NADH dehydrogenase